MTDPYSERYHIERALIALRTAAGEIKAARKIFIQSGADFDTVRSISFLYRIADCDDLITQLEVLHRKGKAAQATVEAEKARRRRDRSS